MLRAVAALLLVASLARAAPDAVRWRRESWGQRGHPVLAIALDGRTGEVAFGDELGASRAAVGEPGRRVVRTAAVTDLVFDRDGALWIATENGLWQHARGAPAAADRSPAPGEAARHVHRLAAAGSALAVASEAGVFASIDGSPWSRVGRGAAGGGATAVALRCHSAERCELWWLVAASVWRGELERAAGTVRVANIRQEIVPGAPVGVAPLDVLVGSRVAEVVLLYPRALAFRADTESGGGWSVWRPVMPPGAVVHRIGFALGRLWLSTDRGLLQAEDPRLGWSRAG
ncbi:MAG: two-component regulator propeller domain-containing protein, partial [Myxococcota bacterium]|nr:two-component regulator propeller domain-containing protein [Myxococcota bacterium]